jgi:FkbM family methyltransferase
MKKFITKLLPNKIINYLLNIVPNKKNLLLKKLKFNEISNIIYMGSNYGGWSFFDDKDLENKIIISAGLGEDASFDIELINKYNCKIIAVDPTPRAIDHYNKIIKSTGEPKNDSYQEGGNQIISSYDLTNINNKNFILVKRGLHNLDNKELKFFAPPNKNHVSYSIIDWQNNYKKESDFIKIKTISVKSILKEFDIKNFEMIKLDIEGSEVEVLNQMIDDKIFPNQILVEFDELNKINKVSIERFFDIHQKLLSKEYKLISTKSKFPDFLYIKKSYLENKRTLFK